MEAGPSAVSRIASIGAPPDACTNQNGSDSGRRPAHRTCNFRSSDSSRWPADVSAAVKVDLMGFTIESPAAATEQRRRRCRGPRFALEPRQPLRLGRGPIARHRDRGFAVEPLAVSAAGRAHPALADPSGETRAPDQLTCQL